MGIQTILQCDNMRCKLPQSVRQEEWMTIYWGSEDIVIAKYKPRIGPSPVKTKIVCCDACAISVASDLLHQMREETKQAHKNEVQSGVSKLTEATNKAQTLMVEGINKNFKKDITDAD